VNGGRVLAGLLCAWVALSAVVTLRGRPGEAVAFVSFCVVTGLAVGVWIRYVA